MAFTDQTKIAGKSERSTPVAEITRSRTENTIVVPF